MKKKIIIVLILCTLTVFYSCENTPKNKETKIQAPVPADSIILKYKFTQFRKDKLSRGIYNYIDTTYQRGNFVVRDTINEINVTSQGRGFLILGRPKNHEDVQCFFANDKELDSLSLNQVITISCDRMTGRAISKIISSDTVNIFVVQMGKCKLNKN